MRKIISFLSIAILMVFTLGTQAEASVIRGKRYYVKYLKKPCGFKGDVMGKMHTKKEWRDAYRNGTINLEIKKICPNIQTFLSEKKQKHIYHFLSSFASDSGNVPSCN